MSAHSDFDPEEHHHSIDPAMLSPAALEVTRGLRDAGFDALLVGGCVRDLLLGHAPKDYDIATDATPEQVRGVFRRSRIIGRRFRIVHVRVGREVIEVTTFRAKPEAGQTSSTKSGRILDDNVWGDLDSDAERRDFTINALYYDPLNDEGIDHVNGLTDLENGLIRIIGDPSTRFSEDPVRVLRAIRFMAKLGFSVETATEQAMRKAVPLLTGVPAARLFDEVLKLFHHGYGQETCRLMHHYGVLKRLFPVLKGELGGTGAELPVLIASALGNTDKRVNQGKPVIAAFLFAAFLWGPMKKRMDELMDSGRPAIESLYRAADEVISRECEVIAIPRAVSVVVKEIWELELRLRDQRPKTIQRLMENRRFRAAFDFLLLRVETEGEGADLAEWWTAIQTVEFSERQAMINDLRSDAGLERKRRRRPRKRRSPGSQH